MYFPWAGFFEQMRLADVYVWLDDAQFSKGSFTNRVQVLLEKKPVWMTVPLAKKSGRSIKDLDSKGSDWRASHRALLEQSFRNYSERSLALAVFDDALRHDRLVDSLISSCEKLAMAMGLEAPRFERSSSLNIGGQSSERVVDIVRHFDGTQYITGHGAANYLDFESFEAAGIDVEFMNYSVLPWAQQGDAFTPYVTALDLLAVRGPEALGHLAPKTMNWRTFKKKRE